MHLKILLVLIQNALHLWRSTIAVYVNRYHHMFWVQISISNVKMIFTMGEHCLHVPPNHYGENNIIVNLTGVSNFTMKGLGNISYNSSEENAIQPSRVITCSCSRKKSGILFYKLNDITSRIQQLKIVEQQLCFQIQQKQISLQCMCTYILWLIWYQTHKNTYE